jgi:Kef-type K+ transport system membrane component KefB
MVGKQKSKVFFILPFLLGGSFFASSVTAAGDGGGGHGEGIALTFLWIAVLLIFAKLAGLVEKFGQPQVLGELVIGVILGNLFLVGIHVFEPIKHDTIIQFLAELGVVILLFQIGLESNISEMRKVGISALLVAIIGVVVPFILGTYIAGPMLLPGLDENAYLFIGAALTATSVGITARVFKDLNKLHIPEAKIILGAAVIDDVLGLIILAVISAVVTVGSVSFSDMSFIILKAILFLVGSIVVGHITAPWLGRIFSKISTGLGMKFTLALSFGLVFAFLAAKIGLAPIVGAFAAGLVLDSVHFRFFRNPELIDEVRGAIRQAPRELRRKVNAVLEIHAKKNIDELIEPIAFLLVPLFFVFTGMSVNLSTLANPSIIVTALVITVIAVIGKVVAGFAAGSSNKLLVGFGMVPRGEVGLIFATIGKGLGVVSDEVFSVIVIMVILTTLLSPPVLSILLKRQEKKEAVAATA